jgi:hypothetical protein
LAIVLRVAVFFTAILAGPVTLGQYTAKGDTTSYIAIASAMCGEQTFQSLVEYDRRVFPGYPAFIAIVHLAKIPLPMAALCVTWISAGIAASSGARAFGDIRVGWALTCLIPHYLINSSLGMSEAPLLAAECIALMLWREEHVVVAGAVFGLAALIRPMACFAVAGALFALMYDRRWSRAIRLAVPAAAVFGFGFIAMQFWTGNALQGVHIYANHPGAYAGHMIVWPFQTLIRESRQASVWRNLYICTHVAITLLAVLFAAERALRKQADDRDTASFPWLAGNTAMILCLGAPWGFTHFPRFSIPAEPAMFWILRHWLPRRRWIWIGIGLVSFGFAVVGVIRSP